ncbi:MAG: nucleoside hydrolase [Lachnospiraceae bacterium]|nr:nucleoside hydrolase [Lachnospiraceae bacterium]
MNKRTLIIDCDTGTDDAIALIAALYNEEIEIAAITSVNGNVPLEYTAANNLNLVEYLGFIRMKVARGASIAFYQRDNIYGDTQGATGLGNVKLPTATVMKYTEDNAVDIIYKEAVRLHGELELVVTGPMTNVAIAISMYPELKTLIKHIWFMGGAIRGGNTTRTAEFNIWVDPVAAKMVLASGVPMTMVGLDVTELAIMTKEDADKIRSIGTKASTLVADILEFMFERFAKGGEDAMMHDALTLGAALCPECVKCEKYFVDVECGGEYTAGHTMVDIKSRSGKKPNVDVAVKLDLQMFKDWLISSIKSSRDDTRRG